MSSCTSKADETNSQQQSKNDKDTTTVDGNMDDVSNNPTGDTLGFKAPVSFIMPVSKPVSSNVFSSESKPDVPQVAVKPKPKTLKRSDVNSHKTKSCLSQTHQSKEIPISYIEPPWTGLCEGKYSFDVLKSGNIIDNIDLTSKTHFVFGRLKTCDIPMDHPSLSRYHAVVQYCCEKKGNRDIGWYLYDLGSTHGSWVNKRKVDTRIYVRLRVGYIIKFGGSSRLHILQGPSDDQEIQSELTITEMKQKREREKFEAELLKSDEQKTETKSSETDKDEGCSWGMDSLDSHDAETDPDAPNPFALDAQVSEHLDLDDPKKTLRGYFEREGLDMPEYDASELGHGKHKCTVELPIDDASGRPIVAEATVTGKKKESVIACALEACRILDRHGELRKATHESRQRKSKNWEENDFYNSDDDTYLDRTGDIEKKRQQRMKRLGKEKEAAMNYQTIRNKLNEIETESADIQKKLDEAKAQAAGIDAHGGGLDALDAFMANIKSGAMDTKTKMALKRRMFDLRKEQAKLEKLANVAKPASIPVAKSKVSPAALPMFGKRKIPMKKMSMSKPPSKTSVPSTVESDESEAEENEEESTPKKVQKFEVQKSSEVNIEVEKSKSNDSLLDVTVKSNTDNLQPKASSLDTIVESGSANLQPKDSLLDTTVESNSILSTKDRGKSVTNDCSQDTAISNGCIVVESGLYESSNTDNKESGLYDSSNTDNNKESDLYELSNTDNNKETDVVDSNSKNVETVPTDSNYVNKSRDEIKPITVKGPTLPPQLEKIRSETEVEGDMKNEENTSEGLEMTKAPITKKRKRQRRKPDAKGSTDIGSADPDFAVWLPPRDQSGDGKTHLNAKFGY